MSRLYVDRRAFVAKMLDDYRICEAHWDEQCQIATVDVHEKLPRSQGGKIVGGKRSDYLVVCRYCHDMIETNPIEAHNRGFRYWSWERDR